MKKLLIVMTVALSTCSILPLTSLFANASAQKENEFHAQDKNLFVKMLEKAFADKPAMANAVCSTSSIRISFENGCAIHTATYDMEGVRVISFLSGDKKGLQIATDGVDTIESSDIEIHEGYAFHYYPGVKVRSDASRQTVEFN